MIQAELLFGLGRLQVMCPRLVTPTLFTTDNRLIQHTACGMALQLDDAMYAVYIT